MEKALNFLLDWATTFVRHMDIHKKEIESIERFKTHIKVVFKNKVVLYIGMQPFDDKLILQHKSDDSIVVVTFNTRKNLNTLIREWPDIIRYERLAVIFVNPLSETEHKWLIKPHLHNKWADAGSLKQGLNSLFETVEEISKSQIESLEPG